MIDFGKLYCDIHPHEIITNFCLKETCMVGLCATCICTHTEHHANNKTTPEYQNIRVTFSSMHDMIRKKISSLDSQKNRIEKITEFVQTKRRALRQNVEVTRIQAIAAVNKFFDNKEKTMLREVESEEKKMGLHSEARMESLMNSLNRETSVLITSAQELNSHNFLESYQRIKTQTLLNANKLEQEISRQLDRNQDFETIINSSNEFVQGIFNVLEQSLQLTFKMNFRPVIQKVQQPQSTVFTNDSAIICQEKVTSRFGAQNFENYSLPSYRNRQSATMDSNGFSTVSFSHVPDMQKKQTANFNIGIDSQKHTTKSIPLQETEKSSIQQSARQSKSLIKQMYQSEIIKQFPVQTQMLRERDTNERQLHQSLNKSMINRNHQSQIILVEKPFGYQSPAGWNSPNAVKQIPQGINQSFIENLNHFGPQKLNSNAHSQITIRNQSAANLYQYPKHVMGQKLNFTPQIYEANQFSASKVHQNQNLSSECKKVRKSGLSLLKANQNISTSRSKLHVQ